MTDLTVGDLFCGCGGASLGIQEAGFKHLWAYDADPKAVASFNRNVAPVAICHAVESISGQSLSQIGASWQKPMEMDDWEYYTPCLICAR